MERRRGSESGPESRPAPSYLEPVTPPLVTPLVDNGSSIEEALTNIVDSIREQNEQMSLRMSELERQSTSREKACRKRSTATDKKLEEAKNA